MDVDRVEPEEGSSEPPGLGGAEDLAFREARAKRGWLGRFAGDRGLIGHFVGDKDHAAGNTVAIAVFWLLALLTSGMWFESHRSGTLQVVTLVFTTIIGFIAGRSRPT